MAAAATVTAEFQPFVQINNVTRTFDDVMRNPYRIQYELVSDVRFDPGSNYDREYAISRSSVARASGRSRKTSGVQSLDLCAGWFDWISTSGQPYQWRASTTLLLNQAIDPKSYYRMTFWVFPDSGLYGFHSLSSGGALALDDVYGGVGKPIEQQLFSLPANLTPGSVIDLNDYRLAQS
jgi:hypothetical protein